MKTIIFISMLLFCSICNGQYPLIDTLHDNNNLKIITNHNIEPYYYLSIEDDTGTVFYYSTEDSIMKVTDSLRTIKWLIQLVIEKDKELYNLKPKFYNAGSLPAYKSIKYKYKTN